jgi:hypothetical protein
MRVAGLLVSAEEACETVRAADAAGRASAEGPTGAYGVATGRSPAQPSRIGSTGQPRGAIPKLMAP